MARARLERDGDVGELVLDDPPLNLFGREMVGDILTALDAAQGVRALLVRAEGEYFTRGADALTAEIGAPLFETEDLRGASGRSCPTDRATPTSPAVEASRSLSASGPGSVGPVGPASPA